MRRREFLTGALGACAWLRSARAQAPAKVPRVAILTYGSASNARSRSEAFQRGMRDLGYVEGRNVRYEWRSANGQPDLLRDLALELSRRDVDVIVSSSTGTTDALLQATKSIPIVMTTVDDPVARGFVRSLARPGSNVTGLTTNILDHVAKFLDLLASAVSGLTTAAALMNPANSIYRPYRTRLEAAARASRVRLVVLEATTPGEIERAFGRAAADRVGGVVVMSDRFLYSERIYIAELAARLRLPAIYPQQGYSDAGGLMSYGQNSEDNYFRASAYVDKILKGAKPAVLPIEQSSNFELVINRDAARAIGLALPQELLRRARRVIG